MSKCDDDDDDDDDERIDWKQDLIVEEHDDALIHLKIIADLSTSLKDRQSGHT